MDLLFLDGPFNIGFVGGTQALGGFYEVGAYLGPVRLHSLSSFLPSTASELFRLLLILLIVAGIVELRPTEAG